MDFYNVVFDAINTVLYDYGNKDGMMMIKFLFYLNRFSLYAIQKQKWITFFDERIIHVKIKMIIT